MGKAPWQGGHTHTCVPGVAARRPGQLPGERAEQVEESPGKDDDVIDVQVRLNDHRCHANAFGSKESQRNQHKQKNQVTWGLPVTCAPTPNFTYQHLKDSG